MEFVLQFKSDTHRESHTGTVQRLMTHISWMNSAESSKSNMDNCFNSLYHLHDDIKSNICLHSKLSFDIALTVFSKTSIIYLPEYTNMMKWLRSLTACSIWEILEFEVKPLTHSWASEQYLSTSLWLVCLSVICYNLRNVFRQFCDII